MTSLLWPRTPEFEALGTISKFDAAQECLLVSREDLDPNPQKIAWLEYEARFWFTQAVIEDPLFDITHCFHYAPKHDADRRDAKNNRGGVSLLEPNWAQIEMLRRYLDALARGEPLRLQILKSRQHGVSLFATALLMHHVTRFTHRRGAVVAHSDPDAKAIFEMARVAHEYDPWPLKPKAAQKSVNELTFETGSWLRVRTAGGEQGVMFRGVFLDFAVTSESAKYPRGDNETFNSLSQNFAQGSFNVWIDESTANGQRGGFWQRFKTAYYTPDKSAWQHMFVPCTRRYDATPRYLSLSENEKDFIQSTLTEKERIILERHAKELEHPLHFIKWYRNTWKEMEGDDDDKDRAMAQENPLTALEAFQARGGSVFHKVLGIIKAQVDVCASRDAESEPWTGHIDSSDPAIDDISIRETFLTPKPTMVASSKRPGMEAPLIVWRNPLPKHEYLMAFDTAESESRNADFTSIHVWDMTRCEYVARWMAKRMPELLNLPVRLLSKHYNDAKITGEVNLGYGPALMRDLERSDRLPCLVLGRDVTTIPGQPPESRWGWRTTPQSKPTLISTTRAWLRKSPKSFTDPLMLDQLQLFEEVESKVSGKIKVEGARGSDHDDAGMSGMIVLVTHDILTGGLKLPDPDVVEGPKPDAPPMTCKQRMEMGKQMLKDRQEAQEGFSIRNFEDVYF